MSPRPHNRSRPTMRGVGAKATTPSSESRAQALRNSIAAGQVRKNADRSVDWDAVIERFKRDMRRRYRAEIASRDETNNAGVSKRVETGQKDAQKDTQGRQRAFESTSTTPPKGQGGRL